MTGVISLNAIAIREELRSFLLGTLTLSHRCVHLIHMAALSFIINDYMPFQPSTHQHDLHMVLASQKRSVLIVIPSLEELPAKAKESSLTLRQASPSQMLI